MGKSRWDNPYWGSYRQIEKRLIELSHTIYIDDDQLNVYSSEIADMILSVSSKIESVLKDIFENHFYVFMVDQDLKPLSKASKTKFNISNWSRKSWKYDHDCLREIESKLLLSKKEVIVNSPNFHFKKHTNTLRPFAKIINQEKWDFAGGDWEVIAPDNIRIMTGNIYETTNWNKNYQAVKHNYNESLSESATLKTLIMSLAAFYLLLIYLEFYNSSRYIDQEYMTYEILSELESEIFSVYVHNAWEPKFFTNSAFGNSLDKHQNEEKDKAVLLRILHRDKYDKFIKFEERYKMEFPEKSKYDLAIFNNKADIKLKEKKYMLEVERLMSNIPSNYMIILNSNLQDPYEFHNFSWSKYKMSKYKNKREKIIKELKIGDEVRLVESTSEITEGKILDILPNRIKLKTKFISQYTTPIGNIVNIDIINK